MLVYSIRAYKLYLTESANWIHVIFMSMYPIMGTAMYGSIYITLAVSIERYLGKYKWENLKKPKKRWTHQFRECISSPEIGNWIVFMCSYFFLCIGVVYPMQSRTRPRRNLWAYLLPVLVLAISFNVPKFLELGPSQKISEVRWIYKSLLDNAPN